MHAHRFPVIVVAALAAINAHATDAVYGNEEVVVEQRLAAAPPEVAACLVKNSQRVSYPRGLAPSDQFRHPSGASIRLDQWFYYRRSGWRTSFDLQPSDGGSIVRVTMPVGYSLTEGYKRASTDLIAYCAAHPIG